MGHGVNFHTTGNSYQTYDTAGAGQTTGTTKLSEEYLSIVREFGLEDTDFLRDAFAEHKPGPVDMSNLLSMSTKLDGMSGSISDVFTVMLLIAQMSHENREASRAMRDTQQQSQLDAMQTAADEIRKAADLALAAGIVSGVMQMASGALNMVGGIKGLKDLKGLNATPDAPKTTNTNPSTTGNRPRADAMSGRTNSSESQTGSVPADIKLEQIKASGRIFEGAGSLATGVGGVVSAGLTRASEEHKAEEQEANIDAKKHEMLAEKETDFMQFNRDMIGKVAQIMKDLIQLNLESEKAAATI
jgi:hypothetical protein